jgi:hypothetical protein
MSGAKVGTLTGTAAIITHFTASRYLPPYKHLQTSFKVFLVSSAFIAGFFTETDRAAMKEDREFGLKFSISRGDELELKEVSAAGSSYNGFGGLSGQGILVDGVSGYYGRNALARTFGYRNWAEAEDRLIKNRVSVAFFFLLVVVRVLLCFTCFT